MLSVMNRNAMAVVSPCLTLRNTHVHLQSADQTHPDQHSGKINLMGKFDHDVMLDTFYENDGKFPDTEVAFYPGVAAHILQRQQSIESRKEQLIQKSICLRRGKLGDFSDVTHSCYMYWWDFATFIPETMQAHKANILPELGECSLLTFRIYPPGLCRKLISMLVITILSNYLFTRANGMQQCRVSNELS
ncbi:uncharacterized protein RAG0_15501 [Rhynchosporium agropyri]|uniref:Uncharacterized protein n=1 Tax=Rhynchosporium agropyri TaxID=914238 RepID=A0A1E1LLI1_9HELO|nr:uncharacterized protein RAG0_15501 [Rhynchosporium agropyri]